MEAVYYHTKSGTVPVKEYLDKYIPNKEDDQKTKESKIRNHLRINSVIKLATEKNGIPGGGFSSPVSGYKFQKLKIRENNESQIRILYFCFNEEKLVLLNVWEKPKLYGKIKRKKEKLKEKKICEITKGYYDDFIKNPNQYEKYQ